MAGIKTYLPMYKAWAGSFFDDGYPKIIAVLAEVALGESRRRNLQSILRILAESGAAE